MHSKSTLISLALLASSSSVLSAPIPEASSIGQLQARGELGSLLSGLFGGSFESLLKGFLGSVSGGTDATATDAAANSTTTSERRGVGSTIVGDLGQAAEAGIGSLVSGGGVSGAATSAIESIIQKLFAKRALSDLSDDEVITLLQHVSDLQNGSSKASKRALADLTTPVSSGVNPGGPIAIVSPIDTPLPSTINPGGPIISPIDTPLPSTINPGGPIIPVSAREIEARSGLGSLLSSLSGGSIENHIKGVLGPVTSSSAPSQRRRALSDLTDGEVIALLQQASDVETGKHKREIEACGSLGSLLSSLSGGSIENLIKGVLSPVTSSSAPSQRRRALSDLTDEEVIALLQQVSDVETGKHKREMSLNELD